LGIGVGIAPRFTPGLHGWKPEPRDSPARHSHGAGNGAGVTVCRGGCLLGQPSRCQSVATVGLTESLLTLVFAVALGLSLSTTAMVARRIGEKDKDGASVAAVQSVAIGLMLSCLMGVPYFFYAPLLLRLMGAPPDLVA